MCVFYIKQLLGKRQEKKKKNVLKAAVPDWNSCPDLKATDSTEPFNACYFSALSSFIHHTVCVGKNSACFSFYFPSPYHLQPQPILWASLECVRLPDG